MVEKITVNDIALWFGAFVSLALGIVAFVRVKRREETLVLDDSIGIDVYSGIRDKLVQDYNFIQLIDNSVLPNVGFLRFTNGVILKADDPCTMTFEIETSNNPCAFQPGDFLAKFTGTNDTDNTVQIGIPGNDPYHVGLDDGGTPKGFFD